MTPTVDIVTVNYNSGPHLPDYFEALRHLDYPVGQWRILMVDNASPDESMAHLAEWSAGLPVQPVLLGRNGGFAAGCNGGIRVGTSDFIALLNPDTRVSPEWLSALVDAAQDERVGLVEAHQEPSPLQKYYDPETGETSWCSGGGVLIRRTALEQVGLFDERFFMGMEDVDLSWRFWLAGWRCVYAPSARYYHRPPEGRQESTFQTYYGIRNQLYLRYIYGSVWDYIEYLRMACNSILRERRLPYRWAMMRAVGNALWSIRWLHARRQARGGGQSRWVARFRMPCRPL